METQNLSQPEYIMVLVLTLLVSLGIIFRAAKLFFARSKDVRWIYGLKVVVGIIWVVISLLDFVEPAWVKNGFLEIGLMRPAVAFTLTVMLIRLLSWKH